MTRIKLCPPCRGKTDYFKMKNFHSTILFVFHLPSYVCPCSLTNCSTPGFPVLHYILEFAQTHVHWIGDAIQPSHPHCLLLLLLSIFPTIRVFSKESTLRISWPQFWSFSINSSPSNECSGLISFKIDWFDLLAVQGTLKSLIQHHTLEASVLQHSLVYCPRLTLVHDY